MRTMRTGKFKVKKKVKVMIARWFLRNYNSGNKKLIPKNNQTQMDIKEERKGERERKKTFV